MWRDCGLRIGCAADHFKMRIFESWAFSSSALLLARLKLEESIRLTKVGALILTELISGPALASEVVVGRWCDQMIPNMPQYNYTIEIVIAPDGSILIRNNFADGSTSQGMLNELGSNLFADPDSPSGDKYRIVPSSGELQLLDEDGFIRTAQRLENTPREGECR